MRVNELQEAVLWAWSLVQRLLLS